MHNTDSIALPEMSSTINDSKQDIVDIYFNDNLSNALNVLPFMVNVNCGEKYGVLALNAKQEDTVMEIKNQVLGKIGIEGSGKRLKSGEKLLVNFRTLGDCMIESGTLLHLVDL